MLLLEHNRCCVEVAPDLGYEEDEVRQVVHFLHTLFCSSAAVGNK